MTRPLKKKGRNPDTVAKGGVHVLDWNESPELIDIYLTEVDERSARLVSGAVALLEAPAADLGFEGLVRDAHTIKGSSRMLERIQVGEAAALLEETWKEIGDGRVSPGTQLSAAVRDVSTLLAGAARNDVDALAALDAAVDRLRRTLSGARRPPSTPVLGEVPPAPGGVPPGRPGLTLGGLLESIESDLRDGVTRVDTAELYRLINRAVEVGLDAEALADLTHVAFEGADVERLLAAWRTQLGRLSDDVASLQELAVALADVPFRESLETLAQFIRFLARKTEKEIRFETSGEDILVDRQIVELLREPLRHLVVNAVDHGIESPAERISAGKPPAGTVALRSRLDDDRLLVTVSDDGRGIDWERVRETAARQGLSTDRQDLTAHLFLPGFTTLADATPFSGGGDGLAIVAEALDRVSGGIQMESVPGEGTVASLAVPVSLVLQHVVVVAAGEQFWGIPEAAVIGTVPLVDAQIRRGPTGREMVFQGAYVPVIALTDALGVVPTEPESEVVVVSSRAGLAGVSVAEVLDSRRVAVKNLGPILEGGHHLIGAARLGGGEIVVVVDHNYLGAVARKGIGEEEERPRVLVVDDSAGVRQLISATLSGRGFDVRVASGAKSAVKLMKDQRFDVLIVDYSMPNSNGAELVRALRSVGVGVPIVMVSGVATPEDQAKAWEAGVDAYLDKFDLRHGALVTSVRRLLEDGRARRPWSSPPAHG